MEQNEFITNPIVKNYEASPDGVIRNCPLQNPVGFVTNAGYLMFGAGNKNYHSHRFVFECFHGVIEDGLVIDHIDEKKENNSLIDLRVVIQSQNCILGKTNINCKTPRSVISTNTETGEDIFFPSIFAAGKYFDIVSSSVRFVANNLRRSAFSKKFQQKIKFRYAAISE